jgi:hypothetical protein
MHLALPPPQASIVSKLELRIVACSLTALFVLALGFDGQHCSSLNIFIVFTTYFQHVSGKIINLLFSD